MIDDAPRCALCPRPLRRGSLFCSRQCAGKVRVRPNKFTRKQKWENEKAARAWAAFKPQFEAWKREFNPC